MVVVVVGMLVEVNFYVYDMGRMHPLQRLASARTTGIPDVGATRPSATRVSLLRK